MLLRTLLRTYLARNLRIESEATKRLYTYTTDAFAAFLGRESTTEDFTDDNLAEFVQHRRQSRSVHTVDREAGRLLTLWRFASRLGHCQWPTIQVKRHAPPLPEAWLEHEVKAIFAAAAGYPEQIKGCQGSTFFLALLGVFWETGERMLPVVELRRSDVDIRGCTVRLRGRKGGAQDTVRAISKETAKDLAALMAMHKHPLAFAGAHRTTLYYHLPKLLILAGLPFDRRSKFHRLRRSHASHLAARGGDATSSLGHSSDAVTRKSYLDPRVIGRESVVARLFDPRPRKRRWWGWAS